MFSMRMLGAVLLVAATAHADSVNSVNGVGLLTVGVGGKLFSRNGHSALVVTKTFPDKHFESTVYNFGVADFGAPGFAWEYLRGRAQFWLASTGSLEGTLSFYAREDRTVSYQRLNLTDAEADQVVAKLEQNARPENAQYHYHHLHNSCTTKIRDLLDQVLHGQIRSQLQGQSSPETVRVRSRKHWAGSLAGEFLNEVFVGRLHDRPMDAYGALYDPFFLSRTLEQIKLPDPKSGAARIALAAPAKVFYQQERGVTFGSGLAPIYLAYVWIALVCVLALIAWIRWPSPRLSAAWLLLWLVPLGVIALLQTGLALVSTIPELRYNELLLSFPFSDVALVGLARRWRRGESVTTFFRAYAIFRIALVVAALIGHATGIFYQQPGVLVGLSMVCALGLLAFVERSRRTITLCRPGRLSGCRVFPASL